MPVRATDADRFAPGGGQRTRPGRTVVVLLTALGLALPLWPATSAAAAERGSQQVTYRGATVTVPADWPVLRVAGRPGCVRFDRPAVYLGDPSRSTCPPQLVGRTQAVHLTTRSLQGVTAPDRVVTAPGSAVAVVISAGGDAAAARRIAETVSFSGARADVVVPRGQRAARTLARADATTTRTYGTRDTTAARAAAGTESAFPNATTYTGPGFDACTARSLEELAAWYAASPYKAVNMYIGGASRGCAQPNLTPSWVSSVIAQGWVLIPTYVGLQAPCRNYPNRIDPAQAAAQGTAGADDAVAQMAALGLGAGNPIYFDMEAFNYGDMTCRQAVLDFLGAWTARLHQRGYASGVYGSAGSTIRALVSQLPNPAFAQPDLLWIARWCTDMTACDTSTSDPEVPAEEWNDRQRIRQYRGGHVETWGGYSINIDSNTVDAAVSPSQLAPEGSFVTIAGRPELYRIAGGAAVFTSSWESVGLPPQPVITLSQTQFDSLPERPATGTFLVGGATGRVYRVLNGVATFVRSWAPYGGPQPAVTVDQAALDNAGTGGVWNLLSSGKPSVRTTGPTTFGTPTPKRRFTWEGGITSSAVATYDVRWRRARWDGTYDGWRRPGTWQRTPNLGLPLGIRSGYTTCVSVRARNRAGQLSGWTNARCLSRALDDRRLAASAGWKVTKSAKLLGGRALVSRQKGATLTRTGAKVRRIGLVATRCRRCGVVLVRIDGKKVGRVNLAARVTRRKQLVMLKPFRREKGTVTVTVRTSGKKVEVDGIVLSRS